MQNFFLPSINLERTGENIKRLRSDANLSTAELSEILGFTGPQAIYKWQNGQCLPTVDNLVILSRIFHTSIENILVLNEGQDVVVYKEKISSASCLIVRMLRRFFYYAACFSC